MSNTPCGSRRLRPRHASTAPRPRGQQGIVLFVALIALVVMALAAVALIRSSDTSGVISGNLAFKEATTHAADTGIERAFNALPALKIVTAGGVNTDVPNQYFSLMQAVDPSGVPTAINWANVPCYDTAAGAAAINCADQSAYRVQYVIDRLCTTAPLPTDPITTLTSKCVAGQPFSAGREIQVFRVAADDGELRRRPHAWSFAARRSP